MPHTSEKISSNKVKLSFTVPAETFDAAMQKAYLKMKGRLSVPGFRKGKAPRKLIESMYGEATFYDEALDQIFPELYQEAIKAEGLNPVDRPELDLQQIGSGKELQFTAEVYVYPDVELGDYRKLKGTRHLHPVSEQQIDSRIQQDVQRATTTEDVTDRPVEMGDDVVIDYAGSVAGVAFDGGTAEKQPLEIGSNRFIPGFEEQLVGMGIGEEKDITVTFPVEYHAEDLAGKEAVFHVKLHSISRKLLPELDDEFAADVSEFTTFEDYKASVVKELTEQRDRHAETQLENELLQQAVDQADCDIPPAMIDDQLENELRQMSLRMAYQGLKFEDYLKYTGQDLEQMKEMMRPEAQNNVKSQLVLEAIRKAEGIEPTEAEIDQQIEERAKESGRELEGYKAGLNERQLEYYKDLAGVRKVLELLKEHAEISVHEGEEDEDEAMSAQEIVDAVVDALPEDAAEAEEDK